MRLRSSSEYEALRDPANDYELPPHIRIADWNESIQDVLENLDDLLSSHGLEIVTFDTQSDTYAFTIEPRRGVGPHVALEEIRK